MEDHDITTVHIADVPVAALFGAVLAVDVAARAGVFDEEQLELLQPLVTGLRAAADEAVTAHPPP